MKIKDKDIPLSIRLLDSNKNVGIYFELPLFASNLNTILLHKNTPLIVEMYFSKNLMTLITIYDHKPTGKDILIEYENFTYMGDELEKILAMTNTYVTMKIGYKDQKENIIYPYSFNIKLYINSNIGI